MSRLDVEALPVLARIVTEFGRVQRSTQDAHGDPESDTTHTVMLALLAVSLSDLSPVPLEPALILLFALVHDLPEVYAGDTCTAGGLTPEEQAAKEYRESAALDRLREELVDPRVCWIPDLIERYERQDTPEARFVRVVDKMTPRLTHILNGGSALRAVGINDLSDLMLAHSRQLSSLSERYGSEFKAVLSVLHAVQMETERVFITGRLGSNLSASLAKLRTAAGLSQTGLAASLGVHKSAISKWESGTLRPSGEHVAALCRLYELSDEATLRLYEQAFDPRERP